MTPGATFNGWNNISINGGSNNFKIMFEGQESDSARQTQVSDELQPSVEAIEQFTLQTSNFSAEFGRVGNGGFYNFTSKSGTNQFHGSSYLYFENTFLNAGIPFTNDPAREDPFAYCFAGPAVGRLCRPLAASARSANPTRFPVRP